MIIVFIRCLRQFFSEYRCDYENVNYNTVNITLKDIFSRFNKLYLEFGNNKVFVINKV